jgi:hypothetical protein
MVSALLLKRRRNGNHFAIRIQGATSEQYRCVGVGLLEHRFSIKNLTPQPPSLQGKGEQKFPSGASGGARGRVFLGLLNRCSSKE